jgi:hypothetical protein
MDDWYQEERAARAKAEIREEVRRLRAAGEHAPVALSVSAESRTWREILHQLGWPGATPEQALLKVIPGHRAEEVIDLLISLGLGSRIMRAAMRPSHAFRMISLRPGRVDIFHLVLEGEDVQQAAQFRLDVGRKIMRAKGEGDKWEEFPIDW